MKYFGLSNELKIIISYIKMCVVHWRKFSKNENKTVSDLCEKGFFTILSILLIRNTFLN
jgi:hypothetical protein